MHCDLPFFRVFKGDHLLARVPAWQVEVIYDDATERGTNDR